MAAVVQWLLLVLALLVVHSQGQSEAGITGLVDNSTLTEWGRFTGTTSQVLSQGLVATERQFLFPGLRFRCSGIVTKWIVGATFQGGTSRTRDPALGIYRDRPGGGFADRVGATVLTQSNAILSRVYEFTPDPPLPFQTDDSLGIYLPPDNELRLRPFHRRVTGAPASRNYVPSNPPAEGVSTFDFASDPTEETDRLPLLAVEIDSDDPDSADCTRDFINRDLLELLTYVLRRPSTQQIVFPSSNFTSDRVITSWTVAADWHGASRSRFPGLQIWRQRSGDTYDRIASTELTATAESPNQLYSGTIDPPLQFQSGDVLGMHIPPNEDVNGGTRLRVYFGVEAGSTYEFRHISLPLSAILLTGLEAYSDNDRPFLSLETRLEMPAPVPTQLISTTTTTTTAVATTASTQSTFSVDTVSASAPSLSIPKAIGGMVGAFIGGVAVGAVTVLIIVAAVACARKKNQNPKDRSVGAIDMTATTAEAMYGNPYQQETTATSTKRNEAYGTTAMTTAPNEAYGTTAMTTAPNEAYGTTAVTTAPNEAYGTTRGGDTTATVEYEYI